MHKLLSLGSNLDPEFLKWLDSFDDDVKNLNGVCEIDPFVLADGYYNTESVADVSIDPNANICGKSPVNFTSEIFKPLLKVRAMEKAWALIKEKWGEDKAKDCLTSCMDGSLYFHDWTKWDIPYCFAPDTSFWMHQGRPYGWLPGGVPKKLQSYIGQTVEVAMDMSQEHAGAIGIATVLVNAAYYSYLDRAQIEKAVNIMLDTGMDEEAILEVVTRLYSHNENDYNNKIRRVMGKYNQTWCVIKSVMYLYDKFVEDLLQHLVHVLHNTFRVGGDSPFTNISLFCRSTITKFFKDSYYPNGLQPVNLIEEIMKVQFIFASFYAEGSPITKKNYRFPICTVNIATKKRDVGPGEVFNPDIHFTEEEKKKYPNKRYLIKDREFFKQISALNAKRGVFNFHRGDKVASCCRLTSDLSQLMKTIKFDSFGNGGVSIGAHRVVATNLHAVACESVRDNIDYFTVLEKYFERAKILLVSHKEWLKRIICTKTLKFFNIKWEDLRMYFSTFGYTGLWDAYTVCKPEEDYIAWCKKVLSFMDKYAENAGKEREGFAFNVEEVPAENAAPKLAALDNIKYGKESWYEHLELLSNQMIPLYVEYDMWDRLKVMGELMDMVSGGSICHFPVDGSMTEESSIKLTELMIEDFGLVHFAIEIGTSTCNSGHTVVGIHQSCPECGEKISTWTRRVVGYNSDTKDWNSVRREWENQRRKIYSLQNN